MKKNGADDMSLTTAVKESRDALITLKKRQKQGITTFAPVTDLRTSRLLRLSVWVMHMMIREWDCPDDYHNDEEWMFAYGQAKDLNAAIMRGDPK